MKTARPPKLRPSMTCLNTSTMKSAAIWNWRIVVQIPWKRSVLLILFHRGTIATLKSMKRTTKRLKCSKLCHLPSMNKRMRGLTLFLKENVRLSKIWICPAKIVTSCLQFQLNLAVSDKLKTLVSTPSAHSLFLKQRECCFSSSSNSLSDHISSMKEQMQRLDTPSTGYLSATSTTTILPTFSDRCLQTRCLMSQIWLPRTIQEQTHSWLLSSIE